MFLNFLNKYWYYYFVALTSIIIIVIYIVEHPQDNWSEFLLGLYFVATFLGYIVIRKLKIKIIRTGAFLIVFGLLINCLENLLNKPLTIFGHVLSLSGIIVLCLGIVKTISYLNDNNEKNMYLSFHDHMTGLYNRRYFENELERLDKSRRLPISLIVIDLNKLKHINDNFGHKKGDEYIIQAGKLISSITRNEDIVARIGGDEFAIILPDTDEETVKQFNNRLNKKCKYYRKINICANLDFSCGYATKNKYNTTLEDTFILANKNMYSAKNKL
jgi:diguanylate cyclase (GGDEF)-like protein